MEKRTVRRRIFLSNALMVLVTLAIFFVINVGVIKIYSEFVEEEMKASAEKIVSKEELEVFSVMSGSKTLAWSGSG